MVALLKTDWNNYVARIAFFTADVFTTTRFGGNPLAVVLGADRLGDATLQALAATVLKVLGVYQNRKFVHLGETAIRPKPTVE